MSTHTLDRPSTSTTVEHDVQEPGDHDLFSHYVKKDAILRAAVEGVPAVALCGKQWLPTRDATKFPVCPQCKHAYANIADTDLPQD